jgi:drug/metabolite transporter (DMT)-like permease
VLLVLLTLPLLAGALRAVFRAGTPYVLAAVVVGAGASATATILFTEALIHGGLITAAVIQKSQPLIAIAGAAALLGERPRAGFLRFLLPALVGFWLVNQPHPLEPSAKGLVPIVEAFAAAVLWALGTVLGRFLARELAFQEILTLRFFFGFVASAIALPILGAKAYAGAHDSLWIAYLAVVTGLLALALYYYGLKRTPATVATLAELVYPAIFVIAGIYGFKEHLRWTQWLGVIVVVAVVTLLPTRPRREIVRVPADAQLAPAS